MTQNHMEHKSGKYMETGLVEVSWIIIGLTLGRGLLDLAGSTASSTSISSSELLSGTGPMTDEEGLAAGPGPKRCPKITADLAKFEDGLWEFQLRRRCFWHFFCNGIKWAYIPAFKEFRP